MTNLTDDRLYRQLDWLAELRRTQGRGRNPDAAAIRDHCKTERKRIKAELRRRGLTSRRPDDIRAYGPGQTAWQGRAGQ